MLEKFVVVTSFFRPALSKKPEKKSGRAKQGILKLSLLGGR